MEFDPGLIARILISLATLGYGFVTIKADFNATHATNPIWTPHARFHVVWQVLSYSGVALIALALIWLPGPMAAERMYLAAGLGAAVLGAFYVAFFAMGAYGGRAYDDNAYLPFHPPGMPAAWRWDVNVTVFTILSAFLVIGVLLI
jgi:hypothetical protein